MEEPPPNQLTAIYIPRVVFESCTQADLNVIFGTFAESVGKYVDIEDKERAAPPALTK